MVSRLGTGVRAGMVSILVVLLGAGPASALFITTTTEPDTLPDGGGDVTLTVTATCEPSDSGGCSVTTLNDDTYGPIRASDCREGRAIFLPFPTSASRTCTVTRPLAADGPTTVTNTTSGTYRRLAISTEPVPFEPAESTVTILGPCERDETEPDECNEDPRDEDEPTEEEPEDVDDADDEDEGEEKDDDDRDGGSREIEREESGEEASEEEDDSEDEDD